MPYKQKRQQGFGVIGVVLLLVVVGLVSVTGWYVTMAQNRKAAAQQQLAARNAGGNTDATDPLINDKDYGALDVKEWGLKLKKADATQQATYKIVIGDPTYGDVAYLSTQTLDANPVCAKQNSDAGVGSYQFIVRYKFDDRIILDGEKWSMTALSAATSKTYESRNYKLYGDKVYLYKTAPGSVCGEADGAKVEQAYYNAFMGLGK